MNSDGSGVRRVTDETPGARNTYPVLSPDAKRIAFIRDEGLGEYTLYIIGVDGTGLQRLTSNLTPIGEPAWSPDGSQIAYIQGYDPTANGLAGYTGCSPEIYVIDVASGKEVNLTQGAGGTDPSWSPDGRRIAFSSLRDGNYEIYTMAANGTEPHRLTETEWSEAEPSWSPDGRRIAYVSHLSRYSFSYGLDCGFMPTGGAGGGDTAEVTSSAYLMNADGTNQVSLATTTGTTELSWSPSGAWLTLALNLWGDSQVYVIDAWGQKLTQLTSDPAPKTSPSWSRSQTASK
jgi:TolB protein